MAGSKLADYKRLLINLLPRGLFWQPEDQPILGALLESLSEEPCRIDERVSTLLSIESDPRKATETLNEWESMLGLPDECSPEGLDINDRRSQILQKLTDQGGLSASRYEFLAEQLGFEISLFDNLPFTAGRSRAGDALTNSFFSQFRAGSRPGEQLVLSGWQFYFTVELPATAATIFRAGFGRAGDRLRTFENTLIECTIKKLKPAHSAVFFRFTE